MVKKLFALASVSALAGLMASVSAAGCSSTTESPAEPTKDSGSDAKANTKPTPTKDGGDDTTDTGGDQCWKDDTIDVSKFDYKPARVQAGACTDNVFKVWDEVGKDAKATWDDLKTAIAKDESAKCASCIFGAAEGVDEWAPIIGDVDKGTYTYNLGGCIEIVSGKEACGKSFAAWNACIETACQDCGDDKTAQDECAKAVQSSACGDATDAMVKECGSNIQTYAKACGSGEALVTQQCISSGSKDAGGDH